MGIIENSWLTNYCNSSAVNSFWFNLGLLVVFVNYFPVVCVCLFVLNRTFFVLSGLPVLVTSGPSTCVHMFSRLFKKHAFELLYLSSLSFLVFLLSMLSY